MLERLLKSRPPVGEVIMGTPEVRTLLNGYARAADDIEVMRVVTSHAPQRFPRWLRIPAPRWLVRFFFVRHVNRCIAALKSGIARRGGAGVDFTAKKQDIDMLDQFERSLPSTPRPAVIWPLCLLAVLVTAHAISIWNGTSDSRLLGSLAGAAVNMDRTAAIAAVVHQEHWADLNFVPSWILFAGSAAGISASAGVLLVPLVLPAFGIYRQLRTQLAGAESRAFATTDSRKVDELDLDLVAWGLFIPTTAVGAAVLVWVATSIVGHGGFHNPQERAVFGIGLGILALTTMTVLAFLDLLRRYRARRSQPRVSPTRVRRFGQCLLSLSLACTCAAALISLSGVNVPDLGDDTVELVVASPPGQPGGTYQPGTINNEITFIVTTIEQHAQCSDPHSHLIRDPQYLRFEIETWSKTDEFDDSAEARYLSLSHWSILNSHGYVIATNLYMHPSCGNGVEAIAAPLIPGQHTMTDVVVSAPTADAAYLQLVVPSHPSTWRWRIPPVTATP